MKKTIIFLLLLAAINTVFSQQSNTVPQMTKQSYLKKSKNQRAIAWALLGGGSLSIIAGSVRFNFAGWDPDDPKQTDIQKVYTVIGVLSVALSVPLFIAAAKNKKRGMAMSASVKMDNSDVAQNYQLRKIIYPSLSVNIHFR